MKLSGIILAGGKSSRMGQDKGLIEFKGKKLIEYQLEFLSGLCDEILISSNQEGYNEFGYPVIADNFQNCGPIGGLEASLQRSNNDWNIVISCDTPFLELDLFKQMLEKIDDCDAVLPLHKNGIEPLVGLYNKKLSEFFREKIQHADYKLQKIIKETDLLLFDSDILTEKYPRLFYNINSPQDLLSI